MNINVRGFQLKILLALVCFIATIIHGFFGYYVYLKGESIFQPEGMVVAVAKKQTTGEVSFDIFRQKNAHIIDKSVEEQAKNASAPAENNANSEGSILSTLSVQKTEPLVKDEVPAEVRTDESIPAQKVPQSKEEYMSFQTGWVGMLLVENAIVGFVTLLLGIGVCAVNGKGKASHWVFSLNLLFWGLLSGLIWLFRPVNTPLEMLRVGISLPQWYFIIAITGAGAVLSLLLYLCSFGKPKEAVISKKNSSPILSKKEEAGKASNPVKEQTPKASLISRFGSFKKDKSESSSTISSESETLDPFNKRE